MAVMLIHKLEAKANLPVQLSASVTSDATNLLKTPRMTHWFVFRNG